MKRLPQDSNRRALLLRLIEGDIDLTGVLAGLREFPWDAPEELVTLELLHVRSVLEKYCDGAVSSDWVERWANSIESREDIGYRLDGDDPAAALVTELANPILYGELTVQRARGVIDSLRG